MEKGELLGNVSGAQDYILKQRQIETDYNTSKERKSELTIQLDSTLESIIELCNQLPSDGRTRMSHAILIEQIQGNSGGVGEQTRPAGFIEAKIEQIVRINNSQERIGHQDAKRAHGIGASAKQSFNINFYFRAIEDDKTAEIATESTVWTPVAESGKKHHFDESYLSESIAEPFMEIGSDHLYDADDEENIAAYLHDYVPARRAQLTEVGRSVELIKAALNDPELNPWFGDYKKTVRAKAEEDRQREETERSRQQEVAQPSGRVAVSPRSGRRGLFGPR
jgi:hypothetical protein